MSSMLGTPFCIFAHADIGVSTNSEIAYKIETTREKVYFSNVNNLNMQKLKEYGHRTLNCNGEIVALKQKNLKGGYSSAQVSRITLTFEGCPHHLNLIQKQTFPSEVQVMLALAELEDAPSLPELIDHAYNPASSEFPVNWFITPFYDGISLTFKDEVPGDVVRTLARLHYYSRNRTERFDTLFHVDRNFFARNLSQAVVALKGAIDGTGNPIFIKSLEQLRKTQENEQLFQTLEMLPVTLTHGDMHPANMVSLPNGRTILFDWGNARIAPAMLDIANLIEIGSKSWQVYLDAWQKFSGKPIDLRLAQLNYHWATIMVNTMYLPHAVKFSTPAHVKVMVEKVMEAEQSISRLLTPLPQLS